jgi:hypothetical protein
MTRGLPTCLAALFVFVQGCSVLGGGGSDGCPDAWPSFSGQLQTEAGAIGFETIVRAAVTHHDAGSGAGCLTELLFEFESHEDFECGLTITAAGDLDDQGRLPVTGIALRGTGGCDSFPADLRGTYYETDIAGSGVVFGGGVTNPQDTLDACFETTLEFELQGTLTRVLGGGVDVVDLTGTTLVVQGPMPSTGVTSACPE